MRGRTAPIASEAYDPLLTLAGLKFRDAARPLTRSVSICYAGSTQGQRMQLGELKRREFITLLGVAAAAWPLAGRAQQAEMPAIGILHAGSPTGRAHLIAAFKQGIGTAGYVEGQNVRIEYRWAEDVSDRLPALARELVNRQVSVIAAATGSVTALAAQAATSTVPIVFGRRRDPVKVGLVTSFNRPSGNTTGVYYVTSTLGESGRPDPVPSPRADLVGVLVNPKNPRAEETITDIRAAASAVGQQIDLVEASNGHEMEFWACNTCAKAGERTRTYSRHLILQPPRSACHSGHPSRHSCDLHIARICPSRRADELRYRSGRRMAPSR